MSASSTVWRISRSLLPICSSLFIFQMSLLGTGGQRSALDDSAQTVRLQIQVCNREIENIREEANEMMNSKCLEEEYFPLFDRMKNLRKKLISLEKKWRKFSAQDEEDEAMWHMPDSTISQLVMDFGPQEFVYIIPPEMASQKICVMGNISIPKESWASMFEWVLHQQGISVKQVNSYCKQLFYTSQDPSNFSYIVQTEEDMVVLNDYERVCFLLDSTGVDSRMIGTGLEKLSSSNNINVRPFLSGIAIVGKVSDVRQALKIASFLIETGDSKSHKLVPLYKISPQDMELALRTIFSSLPDFSRSFAFNASSSELDNTGLQIMALNSSSQNALLLSGNKREVCEAVKVIESLDRRLMGIGAKEVIWYRVKNTCPHELAKTVSQVYGLLASSKVTSEIDDQESEEEKTINSIYQESGIAPPVVPGGVASINNKDNQETSFGNVVVDIKTGLIILAVDSHLVKSILETLEKLDVPERMVKIDFILFEKKIAERTDMGLGNLSIGSNASKTEKCGFEFPQSSASTRKEFGISHFFLNMSELLGIPSFDLAYNFLVSQENTQINANPSILTLNGSTAVINLVEETSINIGNVSSPSTGQTVIKDSYVRAQYGIKIKVKPIIHEENNQRYVSLDCDLTFETHRNNSDSRPEVRTRNIKNVCRINNNETMVIGGLRQKDAESHKFAIPLMGEVPLIGGLFSNSGSSERMTETFILIRPQIIDSPLEVITRSQINELQKRPGDTIELLEKYANASTTFKNKRIFQTLSSLN